MSKQQKIQIQSRLVLEANSELVHQDQPRAAAFTGLLVQRDEKQEVDLTMIMNLTKINSLDIIQPRTRQQAVVFQRPMYFHCLECSD